MDGAEAAYKRSVVLNSQRRTWEAKNGTTAVIRGQHIKTGEIRTFIATEAPTMPKELRNSLSAGEEFIEGIGHAEQTIFKNVGPEWRLFEGGSSRNVCNPICRPLVEGRGMELGGEIYRKRGDKSDFRWFWEQ